MKPFGFFIALLVCSASALANQPDLRPGLWEHSVIMSSQSGQVEAAMAQMQEQLAQMPPEQREMVEQMMAAQGVSIGPRGSSFKVCLTAEEIARGQLPQSDECEQQVLEQSKKRLRVKFNCPGNPPTSGEGEVVFHSPTHYSGKSVLQTEADGNPERMTIEQTGKWLSTDCGQIKPVN